MALKDAYTTQELAEILHLSRQAVSHRGKSWLSRPRPGRGGGKEWLLSSMPEETRLAIRHAEEKRAVEQAAESAAPVATSQFHAASATGSTWGRAILDDRRREKALAKADLVRKYLEWQRKHGFTTAQKQAFVTAYHAGAWPQLQSELGPTSWKSLERWRGDMDKAGSVLVLADKRGIAHKGRTLLTEAHRSIILGHILNPNAPSVGQCVREIQKRCTAAHIFEPSEATVRRFVKAYTSECFDEFTLWREGKKAWTDKCSISILRDWSLVGVGDIVIADGHTLNFETINPETGKPCRMTLLLFFDGASSHPLGWEIMASENVACISSAFRRTCLVLGKFPRVVYLDNGRAFRAKFFKGCEDFTQAGFLGLYADLGCKVIHAWPYHGQSKPIERFFGTMHDMEVWMPSYTGNTIAAKPARMKRGEDLHRKLYAGLGGRPLTLEETHTAVARWFCDYVQRPQPSSHLRGRSPAELFQSGVGPGLTEAQADRLTLLMLQKIVRVITKDGFRLGGRLYWHEALTGRRHPVLVRYDDQFTPQTVKVFDLDGNWICDALDRAHFGIACGVHPAAHVLGTAEQQLALDAALALKKGQEKHSTATLRAMNEAIVQPETRARVLALEAATQAQSATASIASSRNATAAASRQAHMPKPLSDAEVKAIEAAQAKGRAALAAMSSAPTYTPSAMKRFRDEAERYAYLFAVLHEQGIALVAEDAAWMEYFENTAEYQRNYKKRYDDFRQLYALRAERAASA